MPKERLGLKIVDRLEDFFAAASSNSGEICAGGGATPRKVIFNSKFEIFNQF
jgi:hypothetical protein